MAKRESQFGISTELGSQDEFTAVPFTSSNKKTNKFSRILSRGVLAFSFGFGGGYQHGDIVNSYLEDTDPRVVDVFIPHEQDGEVPDVVSAPTPTFEATIIPETGINVRSGPNTSFSSLGTINGEVRVRAKYTHPNGSYWLQLDGNEGVIGWVAGVHNNERYTTVADLEALEKLIEENPIVTRFDSDSTTQQRLSELSSDTELQQRLEAHRLNAKQFLGEYVEGNTDIVIANDGAIFSVLNENLDDLQKGLIFGTNVENNQMYAYDPSFVIEVLHEIDAENSSEELSVLPVSTDMFLYSSGDRNYIFDNQSVIDSVDPTVGISDADFKELFKANLIPLKGSIRDLNTFISTNPQFIRGVGEEVIGISTTVGEFVLGEDLSSIELQPVLDSNLNSGDELSIDEGLYEGKHIRDLTDMDGVTDYLPGIYYLPQSRIIRIAGNVSNVYQGGGLLPEDANVWYMDVSVGNRTITTVLGEDNFRKGITETRDDLEGFPVVGYETISKVFPVGEVARYLQANDNLPIIIHYSPGFISDVDQIDPSICDEICERYIQVFNATPTRDILNQIRQNPNGAFSGPLMSGPFILPDISDHFDFQQ